MIDDYSNALKLVEKMTEYLPIPVSPTSRLIHSLREQDFKISRNRKLFGT